MKRLLIKCSIAKGILEALGKKEEVGAIEVLNKARQVKYIRRWRSKNNKRWNYLYKEHLQKPIDALASLFGIKREKLDDDFAKNNIEKDYGVDKNTFASHVLEYLSNKQRWDNFFAKKENLERFKKP